MNVKLLMPDGRTIPMQIRARHYHKLFFLVKQENIIRRVRRWWKYKQTARRLKKMRKRQVLSKKQAKKIPMEKA